MWRIIYLILHNLCNGTDFFILELIEKRRQTELLRIFANLQVKKIIWKIGKINEFPNEPRQANLCLRALRHDKF